MSNFKTSDRVVYLDLLRIFSLFCVIIIHISAKKWYTSSVDSFEWQISNFYNSLSRFCVPTLFMISGIFFLDNNLE